MAPRRHGCSGSEAAQAAETRIITQAVSVPVFDTKVQSMFTCVHAARTLLTAGFD
jgi:hypothetical protein